MSSQQQAKTGTSSTQAWNPDVIFKLLSEPIRRKLVFTLARQPWQAASQLKHTLECTVDGSMKRLILMRSNGIVVMKPDHVDQRRQLFALPPGMPLITTEKATMFDFGFLKILLAGAGDAELAGVEIRGNRWMPQVVYSVMGEPARRKMLVALAHTQSQSGAQLKARAGRKLSATLKNLAVLRAAGFVVVTESDRLDGRRQLYSLAPTLPLKLIENGIVLDFGFCTVTLS